ncbi:flagellin lysine-N-methylase [Lysinibacillus sp. NPDC094403]|uniref:flagellin lysine-N-methylase n=1 Tax=Lysinibacillus sp. NPDC094403 TaxID=3390581 RepID=UPI003D07D3FD
MKREVLFPEYYKKFSCIGAACEDTCCAGWNVNVDKATFQKYRNIRKSELKEELKQNITRERSNPSDYSYGKIKMDEKNRCTMLTEDGWCKIHAELGEEYLCHTCSVYPRAYNAVESRIEKSLTISCPEAARLILLDEEGIGFIIDEEQFNTSGLIIGNVPSNEQKYFWDLRLFTIDILQNRKQYLEDRLIVLGMFIHKLCEIPKEEWSTQLQPLMHRYKNILEDNGQIELVKNLPQNLAFQMNMAKDLIKYRLTGGVSSQRYLECLNDMQMALNLNDKSNIDESKELYKKHYDNYYSPFMKNHEYILENYTVNYVFRNLFPSNQPNMFESYVMLILNISMIKLHLIGMAGQHKELTIEQVIKLIQSYSKTIEHHSDYLQNVRKMLQESGYSTMAHMIVLLKS